MDTPIKMIQIFRVAKSILLNSHRGMDLRRSVQQKFKAFFTDLIPDDQIAEHERDISRNFCCSELSDLINADISAKEFKTLLKFEGLLFGEQKPKFLNTVELFAYDRLEHASLDPKFNIYCKIFQSKDIFDKDQCLASPHINFERFIAVLRFEDLYEVASILDKQKRMIKFLREYCLFRD